ncbi:MAG TPA: CDP-diacylglycerol--serine O-phosphatidyltransferase [Candidatus Acidoferrales bacterium]|jgi:CDP-diacylglycerol--serine O-phosphatidyltransferase|nr:CDP-diacylglycerol--serine O-phosphatidyltransferase [Candidatus Acidoferrales bacterium]
MATEPQPKPSGAEPERLKIYFLPNLFTAGNLFCGFVALTQIVEANLTPDINNHVNWMPIKVALAFILLACIFDLFDGRVARMGGHESPFGREFDSLADLVSFGVAPAFLVHRVVLHNALPDEYVELGWFIASIYLICGAFRLARFNCLSAMNLPGAGKDFLGFPIPSAAGLVASLTLFIIKLKENDKDLGHWGWLLPSVLLFLSAMMVSEVKYPSFKSLGFRSSTTFLKLVVAAVFVGSLFVLREKILYYVLPLFFTGYLLYGFVRPHISRAWRREIEEDEDDLDGAP